MQDQPGRRRVTGRTGLRSLRNYILFIGSFGFHFDHNTDLHTIYKCRQCIRPTCTTVFFFLQKLVGKHEKIDFKFLTHFLLDRQSVFVPIPMGHPSIPFPTTARRLGEGQYRIRRKLVSSRSDDRAWAWNVKRSGDLRCHSFNFIGRIVQETAKLMSQYHATLDIWHTVPS